MFIKTTLNHLLMNMVNLLSLIFIDIQKKKISSKPNEKTLRKKFNNKINFFYPRNKYEFINFIKNKHVFALDSLGRDFKHFKLRLLINKKNIWIKTAIEFFFL